MEPKLFVATKALIFYNQKVLIIKESSKYKEGTNEGKFDLVGGRIKPGQRFDESLKREIKEETGLSVTIGKPFYVGEWNPKVKDEQWQIVGIFFICRADSDKVKLSKDHNEFLWILPEEHKNYNLIENYHNVFEAYLSN